MNHTKLPSPEQARHLGGASAEEIALGRHRLRASILHHQGMAFTYAAANFPRGTAQQLLSELDEAGWNYRLISDQHNGDYYNISPRYVVLH